MPLEDSSDIKFEIGHVLFIDIIGYSKLLIHQQSELQRQLNEVVRGTEPFRAVKKTGKLIGLPRSDGLAPVYAAISASNKSLQAALKGYLRHLVGMKAGTPCFFTRNTTNFAGLLSLALRPTM